MKPATMRDIGWLAVVGVALYVLVSCGNTDATQGSSQPPLTASHLADTEQVTLHIMGMSWASWPRIVRLVLERLDGVHKADVQFKQEKATVTYEPAKVTVQQMIEAVQRSGFGAKSVPWEGKRLWKGDRVMDISLEVWLGGAMPTARCHYAAHGWGMRSACALSCRDTATCPCTWMWTHYFVALVFALTGGRRYAHRRPTPHEHGIPTDSRLLVQRGVRVIRLCHGYLLYWPHGLCCTRSEFICQFMGAASCRPLSQSLFASDHNIPRPRLYTTYRKGKTVPWLDKGILWGAALLVFALLGYSFSIEGFGLF